MWMILGIASGLFHALQSMVSKKALEGLDYYLLTFAYAAFSLPFLFIALWWLNPAPTNLTFWWSTAACAVLSLIAVNLNMKALQIGELSLTVPLLSFTPVFMIFTSEIMLGESPSFLGLWGILAIVAGTYVLELKREKGFLGPIKALVKDKGALLMLAVALIYAVSSNLNKIAVTNSSPITYLIFVQIMIAALCLPLIRLKSKLKFEGIASRWKLLGLVGFFTAAGLLAQMTALTLNLVTYIISLKRTSAFFSVILGFVAFKERNVRPKLLGSLLMVIGVIMISLS